MGSLEGAKIAQALDRPVRRPFIRVISVIAQFALGALFVFAGATKAYDPGEFAVEVQRYNLIPWLSGVVVALYLPWVEILSGLVLLFKALEQGARLLVTVMLSTFEGALASAIVCGLKILSGLALPFRRLEQGALLLVTVLLIIFTVALASAMVRGLSIDCGCFGKALTATGTTVPLIRNLILLGLSAFIWRDNT